MVVQEDPKTNFAFVYYGPSPDPTVFSAYPLCARKIRSFKNSDDMHYIIINTTDPKRTGQVLQNINEYNTRVSAHDDKIFIQNLPHEPQIITFTKEAKPRDHVIGRLIETARKATVSNEPSTYFYWELATYTPSGSSSAGAANELKKRPRTEEANDGGSGSGQPMDGRFAALQQELDARTAEITAMRATMNTLDAHYAARLATIEELEQDRQSKDTRLAQINARIEQIEQAMAAKDNTIAAKDNEIVALRAHVAGVCTEMVQLAQEGGQLCSGFNTANELYIKDLKDTFDSRLQGMEAEVEELSNTPALELAKAQTQAHVDELQGQIETLKQRLEELPR